MTMAVESNMKRVSLELGGKSALIVLGDADLNKATDIAQVGLFLNQGQCCCASSRVFVHASIYDAFLVAAKKAAEARVLGSPFEAKTSQGPQVDKLQFDKVLGYIQDGKGEGARLVTGGASQDGKGFFIQPTIFADVTDQMKIAREEIFGPVMCVIKFDSDDEVIERANASEFGLAAGIISTDVPRAMRIARNLTAGTVWINSYDNFDAAAPFGGFKSSGHGREKGENALESYTEIKCVMMPLA
ncbi:aldehyde dehydrogenase domain-containing protein [Baffinella frigidus]|nr:aldehyde dehydrogenase domain-containing protein [Cryptophyta sp. CCMP2293]